MESRDATANRAHASRGSARARRSMPPRSPAGGGRAPDASTLARAWSRAMTDGLRALRELGLDLLALLWPCSCAGCGARDRELCAACAVEAARAPPDGVLDIPALGVPGFAAGPYSGVLRSVLLAYKHRGAYGFNRLLGERMIEPLRAALAAEHHRQRSLASQGSRGPLGPLGSQGSWGSPDSRGSQGSLGSLDETAGRVAPSAPVFVPLPSRRRRERERGYRHVDVILRAGLRAGRLPGGRVRALAPRRGRVGQVGLRPSERERNARLIRVRRASVRAIAGRGVILVDDIATTGATLRAAIAVLEAEGISVVGAVALCAAERRDAPQKTEWKLTGERG